MLMGAFFFFLTNHLLYICHAIPIMLILLNACQLADEAVYLYIVTDHKQHLSVIISYLVKI